MAQKVFVINLPSLKSMGAEALTAPVLTGQLQFLGWKTIISNATFVLSGRKSKRTTSFSL